MRRNDALTLFREQTRLPLEEAPGCEGSVWTYGRQATEDGIVVKTVYGGKGTRLTAISLTLTERGGRDKRELVLDTTSRDGEWTARLLRQDGAKCDEALEPDSLLQHLSRFVGQADDPA